MRSSPDTERVMLPTFEEMMGIPLYPVEEAQILAEAEDVLEGPREDGEAAPPERSAAEEEMERVEKLCEGMRREAIAQSQQIVQQAREEAVAIEHKALIHAREEGAKELEAERKKLQEAAGAAAAALNKAREELCAFLEPYFLDTAITIAESILKYELERNSEAYTSIVRGMVEQTYMAHDVVLHLPPDRFRELSERDGGAFMQEMEHNGVKVDRDPSLADSDCLITSDMGSVQGGVKTQLARIKYAAAGQGAQ